MKTFVRFVGLVMCVGMMTMTLSAQAVGDYGSAATNNAWNTASNWVVCASAGTWAGATAASVAPAATTNIWILSGHTVTLPASGNCLCNNLTIVSGGSLVSASAVTTPRYFRVYGSTVTNNGILAGTNDGLGIQLYGTASQVLTITGTGTTNVSRIQPQTSGQAVIIDANMGINYAGSSGTGSTALYCANGDFTATINSGKTVTMPPYSYVSASSSSGSSAGNAIFNLVINGTLITGANGTVNLNNTAPKYSKVAIGSTGSFQIGGNLSAYIGQDSIIVNNGGTLTTSTIGSVRLDSAVVLANGMMTVNNIADFSVSTVNASGKGFIGGTGSFTLGNGATLKLSAAAGLDPSSGPVRTATRTFGTLSNFTFIGNAVSFSSGSDFPNEVGKLVVQDTSGTLTLTNSLIVDTTLTFTRGKIVTGTNTLTLGGVATVSGAGAGQYVDGTVAVVVAAPGADTWPLGQGTDYLPVTLYSSSVTTPGAIAIKILDTNSVALAGPHHGATQILKRYTRSTSDQNLNATIDSAAFAYAVADIPAGLYAAGLQITRWNGYPWINLVVNRIDSIANKVVVSGNIGKGDWVMTGPAGFFAPASALNYGVVLAGQSKNDTITVTNSGKAPLSIDSVKATASEFTVTPLTGTIAAGGSAKFAVNFAPVSSGAKSASIVFFHSGINGRDSVGVTGGVLFEAKFSASPDSIDFGTIARNASKADSIFVTNGGNASLTIDSVKSSDAAFSISPFTTSIVASATGKFIVTYHPTSGGAKSGVLVFYSNSTTKPDTAWVKGNVLIAPAFSATPATFNFGTVYTGQNKLDSVSVTNVGTSTLTISSIVSTNSTFTVTPSPGNIGVDTTVKFYIKFTPSAIGSQSGKIAFNHNASTKDTIVVSGKGLTFGSVKVAHQAANATEVLFEAIVTRAKGNYTYVQDTTGGMCMYQSTGAWKDSVTSGGIKAGDKIRVDGKTSEYNSLKEIVAADLVSFTILSRNNTVPAPKQLTLAQLTAGVDTYESVLVKVIAVSVNALGATTYAAATTYAITDPSDSTGAVSLRMPNATDGDVDGTTIIPIVTFTGVVGQFSASAPAAGYQLMAINATDVTDNALSVTDAFSGIPETYSLQNNYPNPFNPSTTIMYGLPQQSRVTVKVYSILGQEVRTLVDDVQNASFHRAQWNGRDNNGMQVSSGVYFFRINAMPLDGKTQPFMQVKKMLLMK